MGKNRKYKKGKMCVLKIFKTIALVLITYHFFNDSIFNFFLSFRLYSNFDSHININLGVFLHHLIPIN